MEVHFLSAGHPASRDSLKVPGRDARLPRRSPAADARRIRNLLRTRPGSASAEAQRRLRREARRLRRRLQSRARQCARGGSGGARPSGEAAAHPPTNGRSTRTRRARGSQETRTSRRATTGRRPRRTRSPGGDERRRVPVRACGGSAGAGAAHAAEGVRTACGSRGSVPRASDRGTSPFGADPSSLRLPPFIHRHTKRVMLR